MRIGLVALSDYQRLPVGGLLSFLRRFLEAAGKRDDVSFGLAGWRFDSGVHDIVRAVLVGGREHPFVSLGEGPLQQRIPERLSFYVRPQRWRAAVQALGDVDVYYCHSPEAVLGVRMGGGEAPIVLHLHGAIDGVGKSRFVLGRLPTVMAVYRIAFLAPAIRQAQGLFATVAEREFEELRRMPVTNPSAVLRRIPAMVDSPPPGRRTPEPTGVLRLICVGRLESIKGIDFLVHVVSDLGRAGHGCHLKVIGDGSQRSRLQSLARRLGVEPMVAFSGARSQAEVMEALAASDVFVSGSHQEGFSLALIEALSMGVPCVVTDAGSAAEVVRDGETGYVVRTRNPADFATRVLAAANAQSSMRQYCRETGARYSSGEVTRLILDGLLAVAGTHSSGANISGPAYVGGPPERKRSERTPAGASLVELNDAERDGVSRA